MSKSGALLTGLCMICVFGMLAFILPERASQLGTILTAIGGLTGAFITLQVANNGVRGKFFNAELHAAENKPQEGGYDRAKQADAEGTGSPGTAGI